MTDNSSYQSPLSGRYASSDMKRIFSEEIKFQTYRRLWAALAKAQRELGLNITEAQVSELETHIEDIDFDKASKYEKELRHDVMAHIKVYGEAAPSAKGIIHLGATSCFVADNADLILMREGLFLLKKKLAALILKLADFSEKYKALPALGYTHFQAAQLTTVGKRAALWAQDFLMDYEEIDYRIKHLKLRGVKGTTGTQASFLTLFEGNEEKVDALEKKIVDYFNFDSAFQLTGQTYTRKADFQILQALSGISQSAHKMTNDIRILQHEKELEEPFEKHQVGSSAMAYKRNPMRCERAASLSKFVISLLQNPQIVAATQWLERTLDDSANRRLSISEAFLATDAILDILVNVADGIVVYPKIIERHIEAELPFMATETILMEAVKRGGNRQELHEKIRVYSMQAAKRVKEEGLENNLVELLLEDDAFGMDREALEKILAPENFIGRAVKQTEEFVKGVRALIPYAEDFQSELRV